MKGQEHYLFTPHIQLDDMKRCLFIAPHPDDNEIGAGGLMLHLAKRGAEVYSLVVTDGRLGGITVEQHPDILPAIRREENLKAAEALGARECRFLDIPDNIPIEDAELYKKIAEVIRDVKPDIVFTVDPQLRNECHPDHLRVGKAVSAAVLLCGLPYYPEEDNKAHEIHHCKAIGYYFTDRPTHVLDITPYMEQKNRALEYYASQLDEESLKLIRDYSSCLSSFDYSETFYLSQPLLMHSFPPIGQGSGISIIK